MPVIPIIDDTYFRSELHVGGLDEEATALNFTYFMAKYEKKFLLEILGASLYSDLMAGLNEGSPLQKWLDLRDKLRDSDTKVSPIANYIWFYYVRYKTSEETTIGNAVPKAENATIIGPADKMARVWNEMVDLNDTIYSWLVDQAGVYGALPYIVPNCHMRYRYIRRTGFINELYVRINSLNL